jgi:hypothetical protein
VTETKTKKVREPNPISDPVVAKMNSQIEALKAKQKRIKKAASLVSRRPEILELMDVLADAKDEPSTPSEPTSST